MDTRYVEEFLVFAEDANYSAAAKRLFITRPTLVEHIHALEEELGCFLVGRSQGKVVLTPEGKQFVQSGAKLLDFVHAMVDDYRNMADNLLTVTVAQTNLPWLETILYKARCEVQRRYPAKRIDIVTVNGPCSTTEALKDGTNDIVVAGAKSYVPECERGAYPEGVQGFCLGSEEIKLFVTQGNPLFGQDVVRVRDLDGMAIMLPPDIYRGYVRDGVADRFRLHGADVELKTMRFSDHFEYFTYDFKDSVGVVPTTLVPRFGLDEREECRTFVLEDLPLRTDFYALYTDEFAHSENGALLVAAMAKLAAAPAR